MSSSRGVSLFPSTDKMTPTRLSIDTSHSLSSSARSSPSFLTGIQSQPAPAPGSDAANSDSDDSSGSNSRSSSRSNHQRNGSLPVPASPTLSNPDLILPSYNFGGGDDDFALRDWKPTLMPAQLQLQLQLHQQELQFDAESTTPTSTTTVTGPADPFATFSSGCASPTSAILYGNGTMLSDIGEVTEIESCAGGERQRAVNAAPDSPDGVEPPGRNNFDDDAIAHAPARPTIAAIRNRARAAVLRRQRSASVESTSTSATMTDETRRQFDLVEDMLSNADSSNCQGDDEGSVADSYIEALRSSIRSPNREQDTDLYSTATLSARAEAILANAKKRLTNMENNLNRARSLHTSGVQSPESALAMAAGVVHPSARFRAQSSASRHFRMLSEDTVQMNERASYGATRSASALGTSTLMPSTPSGCRPLLLASRSADTIARNRRNPGLEINLSPLKEITSNITAERAQSVATASSYSRAQELRSPTPSTYSESIGSPRPRSASQVRNQMKELHNKISSLKEQARSDSLRRHSHQNMRTPSPFTHAGYDGDHHSSGSVSTSVSPAPPSVKSRPDNDGSIYSEDERQKVPNTNLLHLDEPPHFNDTLPTPKAFEFPAPPSSVRSPTVEENEASEYVGLREEDEQANDEFGQEYYDEMEEGDDVAHGDDGDSNGGVRTGGDYQDTGMAFGGEPIEYDGYMEEVGEYAEDRNMDSSNYDDYDDYVEDSEVHHLDDEMLAEEAYNQESYNGESYDENDHVDYDDAAYDSDGGESLYHDTVQMSLSHEDREDAFDYERFFIHSAMGSFTQERLAGRSRSNTLGSDASVETARATTALDRPHNSKRQSYATIHSFVTTDSYATADDGSSVVYDDEEDEEEDDEEYDESGRLSRPALSTRPATVAQTSHRPTISVASTRSFPAIVKPTTITAALSADDAGRAITNGGGILTPRGSPDPLRQLSDSLMGETDGIADGAPSGKMRDMLVREDQLLVQRLVGGLGKCILSLGEAGRASAESRMYRRRLDAARRILEGFDE